MRRVTCFAAGSTGERGATMVMIAASSLVLFGFLAFAFDFGRMYVERRELQSGADAAALAVAAECATGGCSGVYDPYPTAEQYADLNASDDRAWVPQIDLDLANQQVTVHTATEEAEDDHFFDSTFAHLVGYDGLTVGADATAAWGAPRSLATLPLIFSMCEWQTFGQSGYVDETPPGYLHHSAAVKNNQMPPTTGYPYASIVAKIFFHGTSSCHYSPSGQDLAGGFGWLETVGWCEANVDIGDWVAVDPGASPSNGCTPGVMSAYVGKVILLPYFDEHRGVGENAEYHVAGFGAIYVTGYNFGGQYKRNSLVTGSRPCTGELRCIEGYVIGDWVASGGPIGGPNLGVIVIRLIG